MSAWNTDMSVAPKDRRLIVIDKFGNTHHTRFDHSVSKMFPESGPKGWINVKTGWRLESVFEMMAAWVEAPGKDVVPGVTL